jgi:hypothetical protein
MIARNLRELVTVCQGERGLELWPHHRRDPSVSEAYSFGHRIPRCVVPSGGPRRV